MTVTKRPPKEENGSGVTRTKKRKLTRVEMKHKIMNAVPPKDRWWNIWTCEPSGTIASVVGSPLALGETTELIWNQKGFEKLFKEWIDEHREDKCLHPELFTRMGERQVHASDAQHVAWLGSHRTHVEYVEYSMPGVVFAVRVRGTHSVKAYMSMGSNFFTVSRVRLDIPEGEHSCMITSSDSCPEWVSLAVNLDPMGTYDISVTKRTEPTLRSVFSSFSPVHVYHVSVSSTGHFVPINAKELLFPSGWIEIIGDSDACGFGVSGEVSSTSNVLSMDPELGNVELAWGSVVGRTLGLAVSVIAASGKGIVKNAPMCGSDTLVDMWLGNRWENGTPPRAVVILAGGNDFYSGSGPEESEFVETFSDFLTTIKLVRGAGIPVFVFQCSVDCASSIGSVSVHGNQDPANVATCEKLIRLTKSAVEKAGGNEKQIHYHTIDVLLELPADYAIMMHWSVSGQEKIAQEMCKFIRTCL